MKIAIIGTGYVGIVSGVCCRTSAMTSSAWTRTPPRSPAPTGGGADLRTGPRRPDGPQCRPGSPFPHHTTSPQRDGRRPRRLHRRGHALAPRRLAMPTSPSSSPVAEEIAANITALSLSSRNPPSPSAPTPASATSSAPPARRRFSRSPPTLNSSAKVRAIDDFHAPRSAWWWAWEKRPRRGGHGRNLPPALPDAISPSSRPTSNRPR